MNRSRKTTVLLLAASMMLAALSLQAEQQPKEFKKWPAGTSPQEIGKRVAEQVDRNTRIPISAVQALPRLSLTRKSSPGMER